MHSSFKRDSTDFSKIIEKLRIISKKSGSVPFGIVSAEFRRCKLPASRRVVSLLNEFGIRVSSISDSGKIDENREGACRRERFMSPRIMTRDDEESAFMSISDSEEKVKDMFNRFTFAADMYIAAIDRLCEKRERFDHLVGGAYVGKRDAYMSIVPILRSRLESIRDRMETSGERDRSSDSAAYDMRRCFEDLSFRQDVVERMCEEAYNTIYSPYVEMRSRALSGDEPLGMRDMERRFGMPPTEFISSFDEMIRCIESGRDSRTKIIESNQRLVVFVAKKYMGRGIPFIDLVQEGNLGLVNAVRKFNHRKGNKFSTYAIWWIRQAIVRSIENRSRTIRIPVHVVAQIERMKKSEKELLQSFQRTPEDREVADKLGIPVGRVRELREMSQRTVSLDEHVGDDDCATVGEFVHDEKAESPADVVDGNLLKERVAEALSDLCERERTVIAARYGLDDGVQRTLDEVGDMLGLTRERIRQIEISALKKLRGPKGTALLAEFAAK